MSKSCFKNNFLITIYAGPEVIILQPPHMLSNYARTYAGHFKSISVKKLFIAVTYKHQIFLDTFKNNNLFYTIVSLQSSHNKLKNNSNHGKKI